MRTRIQKWGNSLAVRIPKTFATEAGIRADSAVEISLVDGRLVIEPVGGPSITLEDLLAGTDEHNFHGEVDTGQAVGNEVW